MRAIGRLLAPPPADFSRTRDQLLKIRVELERERSAELLDQFRGAPPSEVKPQLEQLKKKLGHLGAPAEHALREALETALWEDPCATETDIQVIVRCNGIAVRGVTPGIGIIGSSDHDMPPLLDIFDRAITLAINRLKERQSGIKGTIGRPGYRAAQALIDLYCEVHETPAPRFSNSNAADRASAEFAITCLRDWGHPGALDIDVIGLVRSLTERA